MPGEGEISMRDRLGVDDLSKGLGKALIAEAIGTFFIAYYGCMSCINMVSPQDPPDLVLISLAFGLVVAVCVQALGHLSGAHINPAITLGFLAAGRVSVVKAVLYIVAQILGAIGGAAVLKALTPGDFQRTLGNTALSSNITVQQGFGIEFFLGFILVLVVFGVCDPNKPEAKPLAPLIIGLTVALGHLAAIDYTGASMNPARSMGTAVVSNGWDDHWIFWLGPCLGGIAASLLYTHVLAAQPVPQYSPVSAQNNDITMKSMDGKHDDGQP